MIKFNDIVESIYLIWLLCAIIITVGLLCFWGNCLETRDQYKKEAIEHGYAEYNQTTGEWQWKGEK